MRLSGSVGFAPEHCRGDLRVRRVVGVSPFAGDAKAGARRTRDGAPGLGAPLVLRHGRLLSAAMADPAEPPAARRGDAATAKGEATVEEPTRAQSQHARRVAESRATVPDLTLTTQVDMEAAVTLRSALPAPVPRLEDLVVKACALALREAPRANGAYRDAHFVGYARVNVGVTMVTPGSTVTPVVFDADKKSLAEIAADISTLTRRAREGAITQPELSGGTFTVSSLGEFGITHFAAVVSQSQAAILAVGAVEPRPVVRDGTVVARHVVELTLSCDHRLLHGADAARLLRGIRELLERPELLRG